MASSGDAEIQQWFPNLKPEDYRETSDADPSYNCIAWAAGKTDSWWEPVENTGYYWPDDLPQDDRIETLVRVFERLGYEPCENDTLEAGFEKVAVYGREGAYEHATRQLPNGRWTSKLGPYQDIEHGTLEALIGGDYGSVVMVLKRRSESASEP